MLQLQSKDLEHEFWAAGYDTVYKSVLLPQDLSSLEQRYTVNSPDFIKAVIDKAISRRSKPELAFQVADEVERMGIHTMPQSIKGIIDRVVQLAGG